MLLYAQVKQFCSKLIIFHKKGMGAMAAYRIGIDAGGTKVAYGLFDEKNTLLDRAQHPTPIEAGGPAFSDLLIKGVNTLITRNQLRREDIQGVGICMPSFILYDEGYILMTSSIVNVRDFAMRECCAPRRSLSWWPSASPSR